jgi:hypothetical protein
LAPSVSTTRADDSGICAAEQVGELAGVGHRLISKQLSTLD